MNLDFDIKSIPDDELEHQRALVNKFWFDERARLEIEREDKIAAFIERLDADTEERLKTIEMVSTALLDEMVGRGLKSPVWKSK